MPALQVKDFPANLYDELRACAAAEDRSIAQQNVHIVREFLRAYRQWGGRAGFAVQACVSPQAAPATPSPALSDEEAARRARAERRRKVLEEIRNCPKIEVPDDFPEPAELIQQMRQERDDVLVPELKGIR